ncbi:MAG: thiamine pyrophosphate-dependent enzyme [Sedimentisphaerales bacterium]|jgi:2-oxoisovalerate dehydrogenase E1 component|nr:thiamine pyrophosphate-dependent enzyme [Sedimentisphaerales bacterium]
MPKSQPILPKDQRRPGYIEFKPIPVLQYDKQLKNELSRYSPEDLLRMQRDMLICRTFELMLNEIKLRGSYKGIQYEHKGPAHLSIGQEAAAVGMAFHLTVDDHIYGSHRSHSEILAKGLSAIQRLDDKTLMKIMEGYMDGLCLRIVKKDARGTVKDLAIDFLVYGTLAEIFGRKAGFNRGMGGSMHAFFPPFGIYPNNAIVGGSADIAVGAALYKKVNRKPGIVLCNIGDGSSSCGPVWEAMCFATMDQFKKLWDEPYRGGLPLIMNFMNNFYAMGGQPQGETMGFGMLARIGAGLNPEKMHAERIDGYNPLAVADAILRKRQIIEKGDGPVLLDTITYRYSGHSPSDQGSYRERSELEAWQQEDPIKHFGRSLIEAGLCKQSDLDQMNMQVEDIILRACKKAVDLAISPREDLKPLGCLLDRVMFSNQKVPSMDPTRRPEVLIPKHENPRLKALASKSRSAYDKDGNRLKDSQCVTLRDAIFEAILDRFYEDPTLIAYGEENRDWGGAFAVYRGLTEALPYHRLFNTPIVEGAIVGTAVGYALEGGRALVELMYCDFLGRAGDEVFNQLSKWQSMSGGLLRMPVVVRVSVGSKYGAQHSQDWTSLCAHIPGLKVVFPATPYDAKGLMYSALTGTDPVIFFESQRIYGIAEQFVREGVPEGYYEVPVGEPAIRKQGKDLTILTIGATLYRAMDAVKILEQQYGISCEVIDARSLVPFNYGPVIESVKKTRKILLTSDACERGSYLHTMASKIAQFAFDELDAPPVVVGSRNWITPPDELEDAFFPYPSDIIDAVHQHIMPLKGYKPLRDCSVEGLIRREGLGI